MLSYNGTLASIGKKREMKITIRQHCNNYCTRELSVVAKISEQNYEKRYFHSHKIPPHKILINYKGENSVLTEK